MNQAIYNQNHSFYPDDGFPKENLLLSVLMTGKNL